MYEDLRPLQVTGVHWDGSVGSLDFALEETHVETVTMPALNQGDKVADVVVTGLLSCLSCQVDARVGEVVDTADLDLAL